MAAGPRLVSYGWTLGFSLELQIKARIDLAVGHTCPSTQLRGPDYVRVMISSARKWAC